MIYRLLSCQQSIDAGDNTLNQYFSTPAIEVRCDFARSDQPVQPRTAHAAQDGRLADRDHERFNRGPGGLADWFTRCRSEHRPFLTSAGWRLGVRKKRANRTQNGTVKNSVQAQS